MMALLWCQFLTTLPLATNNSPEADTGYDQLPDCRKLSSENWGTVLVVANHYPGLFRGTAARA